jgi:ribosomal protein S27E
MVTYVICKNCKNKIEATPQGNVQVKGNVTYGGVKLDGSSIVFGPGGGINFGSGGSISFGTNPSSQIKCPVCGKTFDYSTADFYKD